MNGHRKPLVEGVHDNRHLQAIYDLYGPIAWYKVRENLTEIEAYATEKALIAYWGRGNNGILCNATEGGDGAVGHQKSEETRAKLSAALKGRVLTAEHRAKISARRKAERASAETKAKYAAAKVGKRRGPPSAETRAKMSAALKGRPGRQQTPEIRAKISAGMKAYRTGWPAH